jgi:16S rRNA G966 N2-methylase RsmD
MTIDVSLRAQWRRFSGRISAVRHEAGLAPALRLAACWSWAYIRRILATARDRRYDARTGVDTVADYPGLEFPVGVAHDDPVFYARSSTRQFARIMRDLPISPAEYTFIDLGCGKGAAILLALGYGFRSAVGVELNSRLVPIATDNIEKYTAVDAPDSSVQIIHGDAVDFRSPNEPTVLYMYHPFGRETLRAVLDDLESSIRENPRDVVVVYLDPRHHDEFESRPLFERIPGRSRQWAMYKATASAA